MLDAFKSITNNKGKIAQKQTDELELLIATAREERSAISAMLTALTARSAKLMPLGKTLEQVSEKATTVTDRLDEIGRRLAALDDRTHEMEEIDRWALAELSRVTKEVLAAYEAYEFHNVYRALFNFATVTLSARYFDIIKDRLYTFAPRNKARRSGRATARAPGRE